MDPLYPDKGKLVAPGYINADPPGNTRFALVSGDAGLAVSIGQGGGSVTVDEFGGVVMAANSGSFVGIDTFANVTISAVGSGTVLIQADGLGNNVDIVNAGTFTFDTLGPKAIVNLSTINGLPYNGGGSVASTSSITNGGGSVDISQFGDIQLLANGTANMTMFANSHPSLPNNIQLGCGAGRPSMVMYNNTDTLLLNSGGGGGGSYIYMAPSGVEILAVAGLSLVNLSSVNGVPYVPGGDTGPTGPSATNILTNVSAANLGDIANAINTTGKATGLIVYNTTDTQIQIATGSAAADTWVDAVGANPITPA
jgi:hypothetical protein